MDDTNKIYIASFDPQAWIRNYAESVDPEGETTWNCTDFITASENQDYFGESFLQELQEDGYFLDRDDHLQNDPKAPQWIKDWTGPFSITVRVP